jgi:GNAT superfamily N-acetyltransferase
MDREAVRPAIVEDAAEIARVHVASWRAAYPGMVPDDVLAGLSVEARSQRWRETLGENKDPRDVVLVADSAGAVLGFSYAAASVDDAAADPRNTAVLHAIYLDPRAWGRGVGTALLETTLQDLRGHGFTRATLWVIEANDRARRFYEARGWHPDGQTQACFGMDVRVDVPTLRYARELS